MKPKNTQVRGMLMFLSCTLLWSISGVLIKTIPWNAIVIAGARSFLAGIVMAIYIKASGMRFFLNRTAVISGVFISLLFMCFVLANKLTTAANAIVIQSSAPMFVLLHNILWGGKRANRIDVITVILAMLGISIFFFDKLQAGMMLGNMIALLSGVLMAAVYITTCGASSESCMNGILFAHGITALIGIPAAFVFETPLGGGSIGGILLLGIVQLGIPYVLYGLAVKHCPPLACSLLGITEAIFNPIWVFIASGESPGVISLCGGVLVLVSIAFWAILSQRRAGTNVS